MGTIQIQHEYSQHNTITYNIYWEFKEITKNYQIQNTGIFGNHIQPNTYQNTIEENQRDVDKTQSSNQCVENVVWQNEPPVGQYSVFCNNYNWSNTANPTGRKKDFDVGITVGSKNEPLMLSCEMPPQSRHKMKIATFNYDQKKNMDVIWSIGSK